MSRDWSFRLREHRGIREIVLGVNRSNAAAIRAYRKLGFAEESTRVAPSTSADTLTMVWHLT